MEQNKNIKIVIAMHKKYEVPKDEMYLPVHVGAEGKESLGYTPDNTGDNISKKNPYYCELTGVYWAWKNLDYEYIGLVHYRRYFKNKRFGKGFENVLTNNKLERLIAKNPNTIFLPKKRHYWIETNKSQYLHAHHHEGLLNTEKIIKEYYPDYLEYWNYSMKKRSGHRFNMFIMDKKHFDEYCNWMFDILFKVEDITDITTWNKSEQRVFGYISERLIDVFILKNNIKVKDLPYMFMEKQNWIKKIYKFIMRKFKREN